MSKLLGIIHTSLILISPVQQVQREEIFNNNKYGFWLGYNRAFDFLLNNGQQSKKETDILRSVEYRFTINGSTNTSITNRLTRSQFTDINYNSSDTLTTLNYTGVINSLSLFMQYDILPVGTLSALQNQTDYAYIDISYSGYDTYNHEYEPESNTKTYTLSKSNGDFYVSSGIYGSDQSLYIYNLDLSTTTLTYNNNGTWVNRNIREMKSLIAYVEQIRLPMFISTGIVGNYTNVEAVDLTGLIFMILSMPFTFFKQAFDFTFFEGTPYAFNISNILLFIIAVLAFIAVIKLIMPLIKGR